MIRREFFKISAAGITGAMLAKSADPVLGLIFPVTRPVPPEGLAMYPTGVKFITLGLGLKTMTPEGYDAVIDRIGPAGEQLAKQGANAVVLMGTSLSFYKGAAFNERLTATLKKATGLPVTTMSTGVIEGLKTVGATRVVAATAYDDEVNHRLQSFLKESGFEVLGVKGLGMGPGADPGLEIRDAARLQLTRYVDEGMLTVEVTARYPLGEAARAHRELAVGHTHGKIILTMGG